MKNQAQSVAQYLIQFCHFLQIVMVHQHVVWSHRQLHEACIHYQLSSHRKRALNKDVVLTFPTYKIPTKLRIKHRYGFHVQFQSLKLGKIHVQIL